VTRRSGDGEVPLRLALRSTVVRDGYRPATQRHRHATYKQTTSAIIISSQQWLLGSEYCSNSHMTLVKQNSFQTCDDMNLSKSWLGEGFRRAGPRVSIRLFSHVLWRFVACFLIRDVAKLRSSIPKRLASRLKQFRVLVAVNDLQKSGKQKVGQRPNSAFSELQDSSQLWLESEYH
jgi:hypothetical protein